MAIALTYERLYSLPVYQLCGLIQELTGKSPLPPESDDKKEYKHVLIRGTFIPALAKAAKAPGDASKDDVLHIATVRTAELLGFDKRGLQGLSNATVCGRILGLLDQQEREQLQALSPQEREKLTNDIKALLKTHEPQKPEKRPIYYSSYTQTYLQSPAYTQYLQQQIHQTMKLRRELLKENLAQLDSSKSYDARRRPGTDIGDIARTSSIFAIVVLAGYGIYKLGKWTLDKKRESDFKRDTSLVMVMTELIVCLSFDPYSVFDLLPSATLDEVQRVYHREIKKVHPDLNKNLPADEFVRSTQRCRKLIHAWEVIQDERKLSKM